MSGPSLVHPRTLWLAGALLGAALVSTSCKEQSVEPDQGAIEPDAEVGPSPDRGPDAERRLGVGQFLDFPADANGKVVGSTPVSGGEELILLLLSLDETERKTHDYAAQASTSQAMRLPEREDAAAPRRRDFGARVNEILRSKPAALRAPRPWSACGTPPVVGEKRTFKIETGAGIYSTITAECLRVDAAVAYWMDRTTTTPAGSIGATTLTQLSDGLSKVSVPRMRLYFGKEPDVNGDGVISVLFSPLTLKGGADAFVDPCDLLDPAVVPQCKNSNRMDLLYMTPPSMLGAPMNTPNSLVEVATHELQHATYFYRKFVVNNLLTEENPYITEGLSGLAQDLSGYQAGATYSTVAALEAIDNVSVPDLTSSKVQSYLPADECLRGGGYMLMRYLFDRAGGDKLDEDGTPKDMGGISWLHNVVDSKATGLQNLLGASGLGSTALLEQFWTTLAVSNRGPGGAPICSDEKLNFKPTSVDPFTGRQRGCTMFGSFHDKPFYGPRAQQLAAADGKLRAGGAELLLLSATAGQPRVGFTVETVPGAKAKARLIRVK